MIFAEANKKYPTACNKTRLLYMQLVVVKYHATLRNSVGLKQ